MPHANAFGSNLIRRITADRRSFFFRVTKNGTEADAMSRRLSMGWRLRILAPERISRHGYAALNAAQFSDGVDALELDDTFRSRPEGKPRTGGRTSFSFPERAWNLGATFVGYSLSTGARLSGGLFYHTVRMSCIVVNG
jgi:hypothetical protein